MTGQRRIALSATSAVGGETLCNFGIERLWARDGYHQP